MKVIKLFDEFKFRFNWYVISIVLLLTLLTIWSIITKRISTYINSIIDLRGLY